MEGWAWRLGRSVCVCVCVRVIYDLPWWRLEGQAVAMMRRTT